MADEEIERLRSQLRHAHDEPRQNPLREIFGRIMSRFAPPKPKSEQKREQRAKDNKAA